jgi:ribosomal protein L16/L10AE
VFKVKTGVVLCEIETFALDIGINALKLAQYKIPIKTKIVIYK